MREITSVFDHWWPVTYDFGLIRSDLERVSDARQKMYSDAGMSLSSKRLDAPLEDCFSELEPLSPAPTRELFLTTTFGWTAYFANGCRGSDPALPMRQLAEALGTLTLRACATPEAVRYPGVILEVCDTTEAGADGYGHRRSIAAVNDGGRWVFEQYGTPFAFEDVSRYNANRKRDRFTKEMLAACMEGLGAQPLSDGTLQRDGKSSGILLGRPTHDHLPRYSLEDAKALDEASR